MVNRVSVWWDVIGSATIRYLDRHIANLKTLGVSRVVVMMNEPDSESDEFQANFSTHELTTFASALRTNGIGIGLDVWAKPTQSFVAALPSLFPIANAVHASFIEFDVEGPWTSPYLRGYGSLNEAGAAVARVMSGSPVPWGITTNMGRLNTEATTIGRYGGFVVPQAYSVTDNDEPTGAFPGDYQVKAYERTRQSYRTMPVIMGIAAYNQDFSGWNPASAIIAAAKASFNIGINEVRLWSWKFIGGSNGIPRNQYAFDAVYRLRGSGILHAGLGILGGIVIVGIGWKLVSAWRERKR